MRILGIETSCDETAAAIIEADTTDSKVNLISNVVASSLSLHAQTGGIIPEVAAREQVKYIIPTIDNAIKEIDKDSLDAIAVTVGPGLIGSLLVGVETAKTLSFVWNKPIIPVNHLFGHIYANWISGDEREIKFPAVCLVVSGGHTDLVLIKNHNEIIWLGGTKDDAAGEAYDKIGRLLNLPYPAGPVMEKLASNTVTDLYNLPRPVMYDKSFDFSFSGLKAAASREIQKIQKDKEKLNENDVINICHSVQEAIFEVLIKKTLLACVKYNAKSLLLGGGVAANQTLRNRFELGIGNWKLEIPLFVPPGSLCTDNAAMIATAAFFNYKTAPWSKVNANPELYFD